MKALFLIALTLAIFGTGGFVAYEMFWVPKKALEAEKAQPPPPPPPDPTVPEFEKAKAVRKTGKILEAREALTAFVERYPESSKIDDAKFLLGNINTDLWLSTRPAPEKELYIVQRGDVINRVANKLKVTPELLMRANNMEGTMLRIGQKITVGPADFSLIISRKKDKVTVLNKGRFFKQYPVLSWPAQHAKKALPAGQKAGPPAAKVVGKVRDKVAYVNGQRVIYTDKGYWSARFWIEINIAGCTLYPDPGPGVPDGPGVRPLNGGISLDQEALTELGALLSKDDPVTLD